MANRAGERMDDVSERAKAIDFASYMFMKIRKATTTDAFFAILDNDIVLTDLIDNYGYYHMYPPAGVIEMLAQREPLIAKYNLLDTVR
jgi:hypothetical protein